MVGDGTKDFGQVGREWRNAISWREEGYNEELKCLNVDSILEHFVTDVREQICKFPVDGLPILNCKNSSFT